MEITRDMLEKLALEDFRAHEKWLRIWTKLGDEELKKEQPWPPLYGLLLSSLMEYRRRREHLQEEMPQLKDDSPEIEVEAAIILHALEAKQQKTREP